MSHNKRILTERNLRIKTARRLSETVSSSFFELESKQVQNLLNFVKRPAKQISNSSYVTRATKGEEQSEQIEAWNCEEGFVDDLEF